MVERHGGFRDFSNRKVKGFCSMAQVNAVNPFTANSV